jgi:phage baseplate assembly protein W
VKAQLRPQGYRLVQVRRGDTLQALAARELGDAARWPEVVAINNLAPPYVVDSLADMEGHDPARLVLAGQTIKVPAPARRANAVPDEDIFGTDLRIERDGGLAVDEATGDWATVSGPANLRQALESRLETPMGSLIWHPRYGNPAFRLIGQGNNARRSGLARALTERSVRADPRVAKVENMKATIDGDRLAVTGDVVATDGKRLPVAVGDEGE